MKEENFYIRLGEFCKDFRVNVLDLTLQEVAKDSNFKTLSGFEHGRSKNFLHVIKYVDACKTDEQKSNFIKGVNKITQGLKENE